jgi:tRNA (guanine37-N1)-methyltransferase
MSEYWSIRIEKKDGEKLRQWLLNNSLLNLDVKIRTEDNWILFPLIRELVESEIIDLEKILRNFRFERVMMELREEKRPKGLITALKPVIPQKLHNYIPKSFDTIGNLVVIEIPDEMHKYKEVIGKTILDLNPSLRSVFKKIEPVKGDYRLRNVEFITGVNKTETLHKENKCIYELDIKKVYFSPRLATEHERVCSLVNNKEVVLDMFAGIGPFSILIAKRKQVKVFAVDINPTAVYYLKKNIVLNKVEGYVTALEGDVREVLKRTSEQKFNRIIMNLPSKSSEFLDIAINVLEDNGTIHYYQFVSESDYPTKLLDDLRVQIESYGRKIKDKPYIRKVRAYAPYIWQVGVDIKVN